MTEIEVLNEIASNLYNIDMAICFLTIVIFFKKFHE